MHVHSLSSLVCAALLSGGPDPDASRREPTPATMQESLVVLARDDARGVPTLAWSPEPAASPRGSTAAAAARFHLDRLRSSYAVGREALTGLREVFTQRVGRHVLVGLRATVAGVDVLRGDVRVLLDAEHRLLAVGGAPHPAAVREVARAFALSEEDALLRALRDRHGAALDGARPVRTDARAGGYVHFNLSGAPGLSLKAPARVRRVYVEAGRGLAPAYHVDFHLGASGSAPADAATYVISADDGRVLERRDDIHHASYQYRVWADPDGDLRPASGPLEDWSPHPTGQPDVGPTAFVAPALVAVEGLNHNPDDLPDPWLPPGAVETRGNNVDAYVDHLPPDGFHPMQGEFRADVTAPGVFDRSYDVTADPLASDEQSKAALVNAFYVLNWMHDWWYDSGFTEATGNAQTDNYGRGGVGGDPILLEGQNNAKAGQTGLADTTAQADGAPPQLQILILPDTGPSWLTVEPAGITLPILQRSGFGAQAFDVTAPLVRLDDGVGPNPHDGCSPPINDLTGAIVLVDRGNCTFKSKAVRAESAGAVAVLVASNVPGFLGIGPDPTPPDVMIPTRPLPRLEGQWLIQALLEGPQTVNLVGLPPGPNRDGTVDGSLLAHEFAHVLVHRLQSDCGNLQCFAMGEGWGDFNALMMNLREGDDLQGAYADIHYFDTDWTGYFGYRRFPYSVDPTKNALSLRHISDGVPLPEVPRTRNHELPNSQVHNAGEIWASMVWEAYVALHAAHAGDLGFAAVQRRFSDAVVAGLLLTPRAPTYLEARDALLLALGAIDPGDFAIAAEAFARRGAGTCAVAAPRGSVDFVGVVEDFEVRPDGRLLGLEVAEATTCDDDGVVDVGEAGMLSVDLINAGGAPLPAGATVEVIDPHPSLSFPEGTQFPVEALEPLETLELKIPFAVDDALTDWTPLTITVRFTTPGSCAPEQTLSRPIVVHADVEPDGASVDDVEPTASAWTPGGGLGSDGLWTREFDADGHFWRGQNVGRVSDSWLESPPFHAREDEPFVVSLLHAHKFERLDPPAVTEALFDVGVIEFSTDEGKSWSDVAALVDPGYNGAANGPLNPLLGRPGFVHESPGYPARVPLVLDFGTTLAGQAVRLRFRIGSDVVIGNIGWDIDDIAVEGVKGAPFPRWVDESSLCPPEDDDTSTGTTDADPSTGTTGDDPSTGADPSTGTTGDDPSTGADPSTGVDPSTGTTGVDPSTGTTGVDPSTTDADPPADTTSAATTGSDPSSSTGELDPEQDADEGGCACDSGAPGPAALAWLGLLGLRRRRPRR